MPTIKIPEDVELLDDNDMPVLDPDKKPVKVNFVRDFLRNTITKDPKFGADMDHIFAAIDVREAFKGKSTGEEVVLSQDILDKLKQIVSNPTTPYNVSVMAQCKTFFTAITEPFNK